MNGSYCYMYVRVYMLVCFYIQSLLFLHLSNTSLFLMPQTTSCYQARDSMVNRR